MNNRRKTSRRHLVKPMPILDANVKGFHAGTKLHYMFTDGTSVSLANSGKVDDLSTWMIETPFGETGGLSGWAISKFDHVYLMEIVLRSTPLTTTSRDKEGNDVKSTHVNELIRQHSSTISRIVNTWGLRVDAIHPEKGMVEIGNVDRYTERNEKYLYLKIDNEGITMAPPVKPKDTFGMDTLGIGDKLYKYTLTVSKKSGKSVAELAYDAELFPQKTFGDLESQLKSIAKNGKYFNHRGYPITQVKIKMFDGLFENLNDQVQDGQAYMSIKALDHFCTETAKILAAAKGGKLRGSLRPVVDVLRLAKLLDSNVMIKGWSSGRKMFGKGTVVFIEDFEDIHGDAFDADGNPVMIVDENWAKYEAETKNDVQWFFLHSTARINYDRSNDNAYINLEKQEVGVAMLDRAFPFESVFDAHANVIDKKWTKMKKDIAERGVSALLDKDLERNTELNESIFRDANATEEISLNIKERILKGTMAEDMDGLYPYICAAWWNGIEEDCLYLHPKWERFCGLETEVPGTGVPALVTRFPILNPAGSKWLDVRYDKRVPINAGVAHTNHFPDYVADVDGDKWSIIPFGANQLNRLLNAMWDARPENYCVPTTKGDAEKEAPAVISTDIYVSLVGSAVRGAGAQRMVSIVDTALSANIYDYLNANPVPSLKDMIDGSNHLVAMTQHVLDSIKKQGAPVPETSYVGISDIWRMLRKKASAVRKDIIPLLLNESVRPLIGHRNILLDIALTLEEITVPVKIAKKPSDSHLNDANPIAETLVKIANEIKTLENRYCKISVEGWNRAASRDLIPVLREKFTHKWLMIEFSRVGYPGIGAEASVINTLEAVAGAAYRNKIARERKYTKGNFNANRVYVAAEKDRIQVLTLMGKMYPDHRHKLSLTTYYLTGDQVLIDANKTKAVEESQ